MISPGLPVLNVSQLAEHWPKWRQYFEIYVVAAYNNEITDLQKLALFLHCLGPDGIELINEWFPQLKNFNSPSAMKITFAEVWNRLHLHCQSDKEPKKDQMTTFPRVASKIPEKETQFPSELEIVVPKSFPVQFQCPKEPHQEPKQNPTIAHKEVEVSSGTALLDVIDVVDMFSVFQVDEKNIRYISLFDLEVIAEKPKMLAIVGRFLTQGHQLRIDDGTITKYPISSNIYSKYAEYVTHLELSWISEQDLEDIFAIFPNLSNLKLKHVSILEDRIDKYPQQLCHLSLVNCKAVFLIHWLNRLRCSLETLHLENVKEVADFKMADPFEKLRSLTVISGAAIHRQQYLTCPVLESLYLDVPKGVYYFRWLAESCLKSLTLKQCWSDTTSVPYQMIKGYGKLRHLAVLNKVDTTRKNDIDDLKLGSVEVHYGLKKTSKSLLLLNDSCLLHLLKFLPNVDWESLKEVHNKFKCLIDPQQSYLIDSYSIKAHPSMAYFQKIEKRVTNLSIRNISSEMHHIIPYYFRHITSLDLRPLFFVNNQNQNFNYSCLPDFPNLRIFKTISFKINRASLAFLFNHKYSFQHFEVNGIYNDNDVGYKEVQNIIGSMRNLKTLSFPVSSYNLHYFSDRCLPKLEQLSLSGHESGPIVDSFLEKLNGNKIRCITGIPNGTKTDFQRFPLLEKCLRIDNKDLI